MIRRALLCFVLNAGDSKTAAPQMEVDNGRWPTKMSMTVFPDKAEGNTKLGDTMPHTNDH